VTDMRNGLENLDLSEARLKEMGMEGFACRSSCRAKTIPVTTVFIQQWDGKDWKGRRLVRSGRRCGSSAAEEGR
jgi:branched-chain amino acid transport system substrate-binding protein